MIRTLAFVVVLLGSGLAWARGTVPIVNHEDVGIFTTSGKTPTLAEVRSAISAAAIANPKLKWSLSEDAPRGPDPD